MVAMTAFSIAMTSLFGFPSGDTLNARPFEVKEP